MGHKHTRTILVIGGTGTQGENVARELLQHGHLVRILTRNPESEASQAMAALGAEMIQGDMANPASLEPAMENVSAIFSVQYADPYDLTVEPRNAANMVQAARKAGIEQVVHTSVAGSNLFPRWDKHKYLVQTWENKYEIEELIRNGGFRFWTILHPCWFMENFVEPHSAIMAPELKNRVLFGTLKGHTPLKLNSGEDTAKFARAAFENPEKFREKDINIASDELSMTEIAETLSRVLDKKIVFETVDDEESRKRGMLEGTVYFMEWLEKVPGYGFDIEETRQYGVELKSFAEWAQENKHRFVVN
ncbi:NmrA/HSCARG family protein [Halalkalibacter hemicellulosilyticus]|uniref:NmrA family protein n=1 Tax=Halalkalibacter hemicellulosilyticusJCM 9152 TaxID=1236971 RepID=W4QJZ0_9BACI|nr:NmrA/HSCARG family protein [Halalkalibacter hemicellulosilyticus]GAE31943.1 NmrA family protein [Halalkalibacter hemicellulosilyticusJCM 9152]